MRSLLWLLLLSLLTACLATPRIPYRDPKQFKDDAYRACLDRQQTPHYRVLEYDTDSALIECLPPYEN